MMIIEGNLLKMTSVFNDVVRYSLPLGSKMLGMNLLIGQEIELEWLKQINCIKCGKSTNKSFNQGFCYNCFLTAPESDPAVVRPELDQAHLGISRDMEWAKTYSLVEHSVYLSVTSGVKVGVTRSQNIMTRWIDQGASQAIVLAHTPYRHLAGVIEVALKEHFDDKTKWQDMLCGRTSGNLNLTENKEKAANLLPPELQQYVSDDNEIVKINYPISNYPQKIKSIDLEKTVKFKDILTGIKGQYLYFGDMVINIRKYQGYLVKVSS